MQVEVIYKAYKGYEVLAFPIYSKYAIAVVRYNQKERVFLISQKDYEYLKSLDDKKLRLFIKSIFTKPRYGKITLDIIESIDEEIPLYFSVELDKDETLMYIMRSSVGIDDISNIIGSYVSSKLIGRK